MSPEHGRFFAGAGLPAQFLASGSSSFTDFVGAHAPELLPSGRRAAARRHASRRRTARPSSPLTFDGGVVMAGDRRATMGNLIANRDIEKVFAADDYSAVGIAGTAGLAVELVKLFQVELEHYEKIEGTLLSLEGKANRLAHDDPRQPRPGHAGPRRRAALRRLRPRRRDGGRIFSYDVTGGRYEEHDHHGVGSGSLFARGALKKLWRPGLDADRRRARGARGAVRRRRRRLGHRRPGPGPRICPVVAVVDAEGYRRFRPTSTLAERRSRRSLGRPRRGNRPGGAADDACRSTSRPSS